MKIVGLTGNIGMGKSAVAKILSAFGFPVFSADSAVHAALGKGGLGVGLVARLFPNTLKQGSIDRPLLAKAVFGHPRKLDKLEKILHPLVRKAEAEFLKRARKSGVRIVILEIPLLFETRAEACCDMILCVSAPQKVQKARVLKRPGMTPKKLRDILQRQIPNAEKCRRADYIVPTGTSLKETKKYLGNLFRELGYLESPRALMIKSRKRAI
jgi:dephospho-CoA kinase